MTSLVDPANPDGTDPSKFHIFDPDLVADFWPRTNALREKCPVGWSDQAWGEYDSGYWFINTFEDAQKAGANWRLYSSAQGAAPMQFDLDLMRMIPLETDPPMHRDIRKALNPFFTQEAMKAQEGPVCSIVDRLMERCLKQAEKGPVDFITEFTRRLPPLVFFEQFLGQKEDDISWILDVLEVLLSCPERALEVVPPLLQWDADLLKSRVAEGRRDDMAGIIAHLGLEGEEGDLVLDERERVETLNLMMMAGMETTMGGLGSVAISLAAVPDVRKQLAEADDEMLERAVDEFLRLESPVTAAARTLTGDNELRGCPMKAGDRILINWAAANRDPEHFPDPDTLDFGRENAASHVAFGAGIHRCLGNHLARREVKAMIRAVCQLSVFETESGFEPTFRASMARGPISLPVRMVR